MNAALARKVAQALGEDAWNVVRELIAPKQTVEIAGGTVEVPNEPKIRLEAAKVVLAYGFGMPRQTVAIEDLRDSALEAARELGLGPEDVDEILSVAQRVTRERAPS